MKNYFIGIDVSKEKVDVSVIFRHSDDELVEKLGHEVFVNDKQGFVKMLKWAKQLIGVSPTCDNSLFCCETTGSYDLKLCDYLHTKGQFIWRENAIQLKRSLGLRRGKDDVADAWAIAEYAYRHSDKAVDYNPLLPDVKELKELVNYREILVKRLKAAKVRVNEVEATAVKKSSALKFIVSDAKKEIKSLEKRLKECQQEISKHVEDHEELQKTYSHITSIKGIGLVNAVALIAYTNNFENFDTANALCTYMGLVAFREMSGTSVNKAVKTNCYCNRQLKSYITMAATCAIRHNRRIGDYYDRLIAKGKHHGIALNNVKSKLVHILFSLVKHDCDFEENHEEVLKYQKSKAS